MSFALDTNVCVEILRVRDSKVLAQYRATDPNQIMLPSMVAGELLVGAEKSARPNAVQEVEATLDGHVILPFGENEMRAYAILRARLEAQGRKIGGNDLIIAATVLTFGATLVTNNTGEFARIPSLKLVDWKL